MNRLKQGAKVVAINIVVLVLLFVLVEGAASITMIASAVFRNRGLAEQYHARYDETLGWASLPNVHLPDHYGPGVYLRTNSQGFRSDHEFATATPPGKTRVVCSGDSYTLGFGVSNDEAWCQRLAALDPRLETVNMGQGGYGVDQAYLWYMRDGIRLDHRLLIFGFITDDFVRMQRDRFLGYGKPVLDVRGDSLVVTNHPVPRTSAFARWRAVNGHSLGNLMVIQLGSKVAEKLFGMTPGDAKPDTIAEPRARAVTAKIFERLARATAEKNARLVLVYFPGPGDYRSNDLTASWQRLVQAEATRLGIPVIDLIATLRRVPPTEVNALFAPNSHYSVAGNEFVAKAIYAEVLPLLGLARAN